MLLCNQELNKEALVCPSCASNNIVYRMTCWRCGGGLPYRVDPNGHARANPAAAPAPWSQAEMDSLMSQAFLLDLTHTGKSPVARRKAGMTHTILIRNAAGQANQSSPAQRARIETLKRAAATLSIAFLAVAAVSGPNTPSKIKAAPHKHSAKHKRPFASATSPSRSFAKLSAQASLSVPAQTQREGGRFLLGVETSKLRDEVWARKQDFLTKALNMVSDYEAAHGPVAPAPRGVVVKAGAPYPAYVACMKRALIQEGIL